MQQNKIPHFIGEDYFVGDPPSFVIDSFLPSRRLMLISGTEGSGKTKLALSIAKSVATGDSFLGLDVEEGDIAYFNLDLVDRYDMQQRCWELGGESTEWTHRVRWYEGAINMLEDLSHTQDKSFLRIDQFAEELEGFKLIVLDTLSRCVTAADLDERHEKDMDNLVGHILHLARRTGAAVLLLHHRPKNTEMRTGRGSTAIAARVDIEMLLDGSMTDKITMEIRKTRIHQVTSIFPIEITSAGYHLNQLTSHGEPIGAWLGLLNQISANESQFELDCLWFESMFLHTGHPIDEFEKMLSNNEIRQLFGAESNPEARDRRMKEVTEHFIKAKKLRKEKRGSNPYFYMQVKDEPPDEE